MTWIVVQSFSFPYEAQIAKTQLEAAGIPARIENEHTINMDWLYSNALGGVRLLVLESDLEEARTLLAQDFSKELQQQFGLSENCPNCDSSDIQPYTEGKRPAYLVFLLLGFPLFFYKNGMKCQRCQYFWS
ncbi:putative signal transducing protein [Acinetobacter beijerinckii]|uniref:putative signal transducing protein n=1 Tax=Acinetobacter beijerinckii TaxID=262668 RepID=UPI004054C276